VNVGNPVVEEKVVGVVFSASTATVTSGTPVTLTWSSTNATACTGTGFTPSGTSGSVTVTPTATTKYSISCTGTGSSKNVANGDVTITVTGTTGTAVNSEGYSITLLGALGASSTAGGTITVSLEVKVPNCNSYTVDWGDGTDMPKTVPAGCVSTTGQKVTVTHAYAKKQVYTASLKDASGAVKATTPVVVTDTSATSIAIPTTRAEFTQHLYKCILNRDAGAEGQAYIASIPDGTLLLTIYEIFFKSAEYLALNTSNDKYVDQLYECVLFRKAEADGKAYWVNALSSGSTRTLELTSFISVPEFQDGIGVNLQSATGFLK
jgi:hypothetical protein